MPAIVLTFPVSINMQSGDIQLFGQQVTSDDKLISLDVKIPALDLSGMIMYIQMEGNADDIQLRSSYAFTNFDSTNIVADLSGSLNESVTIDVSGVYTWWPNSQDSRKSDPESPLYNYESIYQFLLGWISYNVFSHPLAQAAISNDTQILSSIGEGKIAESLLTALQGLTNEQLKSIFQQMVKQDPLRFKRDDLNSTEQPISHPTASPQFIPFKKDDKIRFEIHLLNYDVVNAQAPSNPDISGMVGSSTGGLLTSSGNDYFTLEVSLSDSTVADVSGAVFPLVRMNIGSPDFQMSIYERSNCLNEYIDWGDGSTSTFNAGGYGHTYTDGETNHIVTFYSDAALVSHILFNEGNWAQVSNLISIEFLDLSMKLDLLQIDNAGTVTIPGLPRSITHLLIRKCSITNPESIPTNLQSLNLSSSTVTVFPLLQNIQSLDLSYSNMSVLPVLPNVENLDISYLTGTCDFSNLPLCTSLIQLFIRQNNLTAIPALPPNVTWVMLEGNYDLTDISALNSINLANVAILSFYLCNISQATAEEFASILPATSVNPIVYISNQPNAHVDPTTAPFLAAVANGWTFL